MRTLPDPLDYLTVLVQAAQGPMPVYRIVTLRNDVSLHTSKLCKAHVLQEFRGQFQTIDPNTWNLTNPTDDAVFKGLTTAKHAAGYIGAVLHGYSCSRCTREMRRRQKQMHDKNEAWADKPIHKR